MIALSAVARSRWERAPRLALAVFAVQAIALALIVRRDFPPHGFPLDDAWIHQVIARTFARTGTLGFEAGKHGAAATSFGWALLLAINYAALGWAPPVYTFVLSAGLYFATGQILLRLLLADGVGPRAAFVLVACFHLAGNYVWFVVSGMEPPLFVALCLLGVHLWFRARRAPSWSTGVVLAALCITRPEAVVLAGVLLALERPASARAAVTVVAPLAATLAVYFGLNLLLTGTAAPLTLEGRRWLWLSELAGLSRVELADVLLLRWCDRLAEFTLGVRAGPAFWIALGLAAFGAAVVVRRRWRRLQACLAIAAVHLGVYAVIFPATGNGGRYQPLVPPLFLLLSGLGAMTLVDDVSALLRRSPAAGRALATALALPPIVCLFRWGGHEASAVRHVQRTEEAMGHLVAQLPPGARVASFDIGAIAFFSDRKVLDLGALVDPAALPFLGSARMADYLKAKKTEYLVLPMGYSEYSPTDLNFEDRLGLRHAKDLVLTPVTEVVTPVEEWGDSARATLNCAPGQALFKVSWSEGDDT